MIMRFYKACGGRTMTFIWTCLAMGCALSFVGKLGTEFVTLAIGLAGVKAGRAVMQDKYAPDSKDTSPAPAAS